MIVTMLLFVILFARANDIAKGIRRPISVELRNLFGVNTAVLYKADIFIP
jgi:hypothetical protein